MAEKSIRVLIVDDHDMVRKGLIAFLKVHKDLIFVGEATSGEQALEMIDLEKPDIVLMDLVMPGMDGAETTRIIRRKYPHIQVIALTSFQERDLVHKVIQAGAISYLLKNVSVDELVSAVRAAYSGQSVLAPEAIEALMQGYHEPVEERKPLTPREKQVIKLLVDGCNNAEIADILEVSQSTAKAHVSNILSKLNASNRTEAISLALRHHLVD
jgi:DNA-binding NarL/FixJ family response regulator